jgi:hypothetical protein
LLSHLPTQKGSSTDLIFAKKEDVSRMKIRGIRDAIKHNEVLTG